MKLYPLFFSSMLLLALGVSGCSPQDSTKTAAASKREVSLPAVAAEDKGFSVGALMSSNTVYVFFDTQCPHCGKLWQASEPLQRKVKFVWIPIGMINATNYNTLLAKAWGIGDPLGAWQNPEAHGTVKERSTATRLGVQHTADGLEPAYIWFYENFDQVPNSGASAGAAPRKK